MQGRPRSHPREAGSVRSSRLTGGPGVAPSRPLQQSSTSGPGLPSPSGVLHAAARICAAAAPSGEGKGGEYLTCLSEPSRAPRVFIGCGNPGLWARRSLGTEVMAPGGRALGGSAFLLLGPAPVRPQGAECRSGATAPRALGARRDFCVLYSPGASERGVGWGRGRGLGGGLARAPPSSASGRAGL